MTLYNAFLNKQCINFFLNVQSINFFFKTIDLVITFLMYGFMNVFKSRSPFLGNVVFYLSIYLTWFHRNRILFSLIFEIKVTHSEYLGLQSPIITPKFDGNAKGRWSAPTSNADRDVKVRWWRNNNFCDVKSWRHHCVRRTRIQKQDGSSRLYGRSTETFFSQSEVEGD